jgi:hypothetical protein
LASLLISLTAAPADMAGFGRVSWFGCSIPVRWGSSARASAIERCIAVSDFGGAGLATEEELLDGVTLEDFSEEGFSEEGFSEEGFSAERFSASFSPSSLRYQQWRLVA